MLLDGRLPFTSIYLEAKIPKPLLEEGNCESNQLACADATCLPNEYFCDGSVSFDFYFIFSSFFVVVVKHRVLMFSLAFLPHYYCFVHFDVYTISMLLRHVPRTIIFDFVLCVCV